MKVRSRPFLAGPAALLGALLVSASVLPALAQPATSISTLPVGPVGPVTMDVTHATQLVNLSVRTKVQPGQTLTLGFVITGTSTAQVLVRGVGPSLANFGVKDTIRDPKITLTAITATGPLSISNDNWITGANTFAPMASNERMKQLPILDIGWYGAFSLSPFLGDAALLVELKPGAYTLTVTGASATDVGTILAEVYNVAVSREAGAARLSNLSVLGYTDTDSPLLAGIVFDGSYITDPVSGITSGTTIGTNLLLRAVAPSLASLGVTGTVADPVVDLLDGDGIRIAGNDNWESSSYDAFYTRLFSAAAGAFTLNQGSKDAALIATIRTGSQISGITRSNPSYTVRASGAPGMSGTVLVEIYNVGIPDSSLPVP